MSGEEKCRTLMKYFSFNESGWFYLQLLEKVDASTPHTVKDSPSQIHLRKIERNAFDSGSGESVKKNSTMTTIGWLLSASLSAVNIDHR